MMGDMADYYLDCMEDWHIPNHRPSTWVTKKKHIENLREREAIKDREEARMQNLPLSEVIKAAKLL